VLHLLGLEAPKLERWNGLRHINELPSISAGNADHFRGRCEMKEAEHFYTAPTTSSKIPDGVARYIDGTDLLTKTQALRLSTVGSDGWPHAALLSAGDLVIMPSGRIRFAIFPQSTVTSNLEREGRLTIALSLDGGICEMKLRCRRLAHSSPDVPLAFFT
jgi:hypothetical protein